MNRKLNLQYFAENVESEAEQSTDQEDNDATSLTPEDVAKQIELAKEEVRAEYEQKLTAKLEETRTEAEKLAKMSEEEKQKFEFEKRAAELEKKEQEVALRELKAETAKTLSEKGIPMEALELVMAGDAEQTSKRIETFKTLFDKAVQTAVEERLKGKSPQTGSAVAKTSAEQAREQFANALKGV